MKKEKLKVIGWLERVWLPESSLPGEGVVAKIDTGADSGALHVVYEKLIIKNGKKLLEYQPIDKNHDIVQTDKFKNIGVRSSNGTFERRHRIETMIKIQDKTYPIQLTLADRTDMKYDVIIGYKFLEGKFLVDVSQKNI
jgi:hypothetical protein